MLMAQASTPNATGAGGTLARRVNDASVSAQDESVRVREMRHVLCALSWLVHGGATQVKGQGHGLAEAASRASMLDAVVGARRVQGLRRPRTSELVEAQMKAV